MRTQESGAAERAVRVMHRRKDPWVRVGTRRALSPVMEAQYTESMARPTTPKKVTKAKKKKKRRKKAEAPGPQRRPPKRRKGGQSPGAAAEIEKAFRRFRGNPSPGRVQHINPYTLLVAVVLSAQATDAGVNKATPALFAARRHAGEDGGARRSESARLIKTIGLYRTKAKNVVALSRQLIAEHGGKVPHDARGVEELPGVGRKTANVVLNIAFGQPTIAVDTHIFRVGNRTGSRPARPVRGGDEARSKSCPSKYKLHAHHWLILHGRYICVARRPLCEKCVIDDLCHGRGRR